GVAGTGEFGEGNGARFQAGVAAEAGERMGASVGGDVWAEQAVDALKHGLSRVGEGNEVGVVDEGGVDLFVGRGDEDGEVLFDEWILLAVVTALEFVTGGGERGDEARGVVGPEVGDPVIVALDAEKGEDFGTEFPDDIDQ